MKPEGSEIESIDLEPSSHRDPSGVIPAMAEAVRQRNFEAPEVLYASRSGRLTIISDVPNADLTTVIADEIARIRSAGARTIGIFAHSNAGVAELGAALIETGIDHVLVGIPEAHGEGLSAIAMLCAFAAGACTWSEVRVQLATFLTACTRGRNAPELAVRLVHGERLPAVLERRFLELAEALSAAAAGVLGDVLRVTAQAWRGLGITSGTRPWDRASIAFAAQARRLSNLPLTHASVSELLAGTARRRTTALVDFDSAQGGPVQLMNFHQTKGREADAVLLVYREGDYLAASSDREPFVEPSRVLFVSLTRARDAVTVILPPNPHPLVAPFIRSRDSARG